MAFLAVLSIMKTMFFRGETFATIKQALAESTKDCNELNQHINSLKSTYADMEQVDLGTGEGEFTDQSRYNYQRRAAVANPYGNSHILDCSLTVLRNARNQPFKYVCKYFNIKPNEETLEKFEETLNSFATVEQGKQLLVEERKELISKIAPKIPLYIIKFRREELEKELGLEKIDFSDLYVPKYGFRYVSAGGNKAEQYTLSFNTQVLDRFVQYLSDLVKFRKSVAGQRALMTSALREKIKERDHYTCCKCGISPKEEPHLLLEIDHITPLAKGGMTTEKNLQTLCWRCNRTKGTKTE